MSEHNTTGSTYLGCQFSLRCLFRDCEERRPSTHSTFVARSDGSTLGGVSVGLTLGDCNDGSKLGGGNGTAPSGFTLNGGNAEYG